MEPVLFVPSQIVVILPNGNSYRPYNYVDVLAQANAMKEDRKADAYSGYNPPPVTNYKTNCSLSSNTANCQTREQCGGVNEGYMFGYSAEKPIDLRSFSRWQIAPLVNRCGVCGKQEWAHKATGDDSERRRVKSSITASPMASKMQRTSTSAMQPFQNGWDGRHPQGAMQRTLPAVQRRWRKSCLPDAQALEYGGHQDPLHQEHASGAQGVRSKKGSGYRRTAPNGG